MSARMLGFEGGWVVRFHVDWRGERVVVRMLDFESGWIVRSHVDWRRE